MRATKTLIKCAASRGLALTHALPGLLIAAATMLYLDSSFATPPNDNFANRISLAGANVSTTGANVGATAEPGEPDPSGYSGHRSVWWTWTAPANGSITLTTTGSDFPTMLTVFTGSDLASLTWVAFNDYDLVLNTNTSRLTMNVVAGTAYQIAVDSSWGWYYTGNIALQLVLGPAMTPPPNDNFANRITLTGTRISTSGSNVGASPEPGEPLHDQEIGGKSAWWSWTAPADGAVTLSTQGSRFDTLLAVYRGSSLSGLTLVGANDDDPKSMTGVYSTLSFNARSGTTYQIAVDGWDGDSGDITLKLNLGNPLPVPSNDDFANRITLSGTNLTAQGSNAGATFEVGEPLHDDWPGGKSVWWSWTAPQSGSVTIDTFGSDFDTLLAVYTGGTVSNLTRIASNDQAYWTNDTSLVTFSATAGTTYQIAVDGWETAAGNVTLHLALTADFAPIPPPRLLTFAQTAAEIQAQGYRYYLTGQSNFAYASQYSVDLSNWTSFQTNQLTAASPSVLIRDPGAANAPRRFYRAVRLP